MRHGEKSIISGDARKGANKDARKDANEGIQQGREQGIQQGREQGIQQGAEQGAREATINNLFAALEIRFDGGVAYALRPALESIRDLHRLEELHREALRAETLEDFARELGMNGDEQ